MDANNNYNSEELDSSSPSKAGFNAKNELRTLFVSGLPHDIKPREFSLLFHQMEGYEGAMIKHPMAPILPLNRSGSSVKSSPGGTIQTPVRPTPQLGLGPNGNLGVIGPNGQIQGPVAFLTFATRKDAEAVKEKFQGFQIDPETSNTTMKLEFAKSNTKSRYRGRDGQTANQSAPFFNEQLITTVPVSTIQQQFATPVAIDPSTFVQGTTDIYGRNMCWPMCWPMTTAYGHDQIQPAYHQETGQTFSPIPMETLQPILFPTDQYEHHSRVGRALSG